MTYKIEGTTIYLTRGDSLAVTVEIKNSDGSTYNLQNGDGSGVGDYRFVCDDDKIPAESQTADAIHAEVYFNIGGFEKFSRWEKDEYGRKICRACQFPFAEFQSSNFCSCCGRKMYSEEDSE